MFEPDRVVWNFSHMDTLFDHVDLDRGSGPVSPLPEGVPVPLPDGAQAWIEERAVTSLLVLHRGAVTHESYHLGTGPMDRRVSWSMAKSMLSALFGHAVADGSIASLDDPVTAYAPILVGSAYEGATIRHVLTMSSGVEFDENYLEFWSDINRMGRVLALGGSMDAFTAGITARAGPPGKRWRYVSTDTHVLGLVLRGATGRTLPDLMAEQIVAPLGVERTPYYLTDRKGAAFALGGIGMTTRDYGRFGEMIRLGGRWQGHEVVPRDWLEAAIQPQAPTRAAQDKYYGYQWWLPADPRPGEVQAEGIYGQEIYIDRRAEVVIVKTAADRAFRAEGVDRKNTEMFRRIAAVQGG